MRKLVIIILLGLTACLSHVNEVEPCPADTAEGIEYANDVYPIIGRSCAIPDCHVVQDNQGHLAEFEHGNFTNPEVVAEKAKSGILEFMITTDQMPHGATDGPSYLTDCEIKTIKKWINNGAQIN